MTIQDPESGEAPLESRAERFERGSAIMHAIGAGGGERFAESMAEISPELGYQVVAWAFGDIYSRPALGPRDRQLLIIGMLTALGGCEPQLDTHLNNALNVGLRPEEIVEALLQSSVYCGMPKALNATGVARKVFAERGLLPVQDSTQRRT